MNELNEKLAVWGGFRKADIKKHYYWEVGGTRVAKWVKPETDYHIKLPDFSHSLDACFKWLVPKLNKCIITTHSNGIVSVMVRIGHRVQHGKAETPALALCKAIEKLIDEEAKHE